jgi:hypothetical protein
LLKGGDEIGLSDLYADADIGPALAKTDFADWRQKHPKPSTQPTSQPVISGMN